MNTERDLRLFVLPLTVIPLWLCAVATRGPVHLPHGSLLPLVYAAVAAWFYLVLGRWMFPMEVDEPRKGMWWPFLLGFVLSPAITIVFNEVGPGWLRIYLPSERVDFLFSGNTPDFALTLIKQVLVVGIVEEMSKRIAACLTPQETLSGRVGSGFAAGVGFGVAESLIYSFRNYNGQADITTYAVRFITGPAAHGIWSAMTTFIRCHLPAQETRWAALLGVFPVAVIHGLSNTFLHHGQVDSAGSLEFWAAFTFVVVYCVRRRMQDLEDELDDNKTTWWPDWDRR